MGETSKAEGQKANTLRGLTPRRQRFCEEFPLDLDPGAAYRRAGFKPKSDEAARTAGWRLLRNVPVWETIQAALKARSERTKITSDQVVKELGDIAFSDIGEILDFTGGTLALKAPEDIPDRARRAIAAIKVKRTWEGKGNEKVRVQVIEIRLWDKLAALDKLMRHLGGFAGDNPPPLPPPSQGYEIDKLNLPLEVRKILRDAIRKAREENGQSQTDSAHR